MAIKKAAARGNKDSILNNEEPNPKFALTERQERPGGWRDLYKYE